MEIEKTASGYAVKLGGVVIQSGLTIEEAKRILEAIEDANEENGLSL